MSDVGLWVLARILAHGAKPRALRRGALEPLGGLGLTHADQLEVARISLALGEAKAGLKYPKEVR